MGNREAVSKYRKKMISLAGSRMFSGDAVKTCRKCGEQKPLADFFVERRSPDGKQSQCKKCNVAKTMAWRIKPENKEKFAANCAAWAKANPVKIAATKKRSRLKRYGLTLEAMADMAVQQENKCAICKSPAEIEQYGTLAIDHCHATGAVRGLLCQMCNKALGQFYDSPALLRAAADYVERHSAKNN